MHANSTNNNNERRIGNLKAAVVFLLTGIYNGPQSVEEAEKFEAEAKKLADGLVTEDANEAPETAQGNPDYAMQDDANVDQTAALATLDEGTDNEQVLEAESETEIVEQRDPEQAQELAG